MFASSTATVTTSAVIDLLRPVHSIDPGTLGAIKQTMFGHMVTALTHDGNG